MTDESILIFRIGSLGDTVVALPCFHRIARSFPMARRILVTDFPASQKATPVESVLGKSGLIDDVIYFPPPPRSLGDILALRRKIRATKVTKLIYVADRRIGATWRDICFFFACGVRNIIGAPLSRDLRKLRLDADNNSEREVVRLVRCLAPLGPIDLDDPEMWDLRLQPQEITAADRALAPLRGQRFIAISLGGKIREKDWGDENWSALLHSLSVRYPELGLVFFGSVDEYERCANMAQHAGNGSLNLCGALTPRESAAAMRSAAFFLGHDSGPMHLAAAVGRPCVAIFGPVNMPKRWHPFGEQHQVLHNMIDVRMTPPDDVLAAIEIIMRKAEPVRHAKSSKVIA